MRRKYSYCETCGCRIEEEDVMYDVDNCQFCNNCRDNFDMCVECEEYVHIDYSYTLIKDDDEKRICYRCADKYYKCDVCGYYYPKNYIDTDKMVCFDCK